MKKVPYWVTHPCQGGLSGDWKDRSMSSYLSCLIDVIIAVILEVDAIIAVSIANIRLNIKLA